MKLVITLDIDPGDMSEDELVNRVRNRKGFVGEDIPRAAAEAAEAAAWRPFEPDDFRHPRVRRATSRVVI